MGGHKAKDRLDKYYQLARDQGYRARSAFKLIQLAKEHNVFGKGRVLVDLCAAPGGWLQVAAKNMPKNATIVGVDLDNIKPVPGCVCIQGDICNSRCIGDVKSKLNGDPADVVLHDGAPNIGTDWAYDAYKQNDLVLHASRMASELLRPGGMFITKVFRSRDYNHILWVLRQLFHQVEATKPQASRNVSAEIFVVCKNYRAPAKIDQRFFNAKEVFMEDKDMDQHKAGKRDEEQEQDTALSAKSNEKGMAAVNAYLKRQLGGKAHRTGYEEGDDFRVTLVTDFFKSLNPAKILVTNNKLVFDTSQDSSNIESDPLTTNDVKISCNDLKLLGKKDLSNLLKWRFNILRKRHTALQRAIKKAKKEEPVEEKVRDLDADLDAELEELRRLKAHEERSEKRKIRQKLKRKMIIKKLSIGAIGLHDNDERLFTAPTGSDRDLFVDGDEGVAIEEVNEQLMPEYEDPRDKYLEWPTDNDEDLKDVLLSDKEKKIRGMEVFSEAYLDAKSKYDSIWNTRKKPKNEKKISKKKEQLMKWAEEMDNLAEELSEERRVALQEEQRLEDVDSDEEEEKMVRAAEAAEAEEEDESSGDEAYVTAAEKRKPGESSGRQLFSLADAEVLQSHMTEGGDWGEEDEEIVGSDEENNGGEGDEEKDEKIKAYSAHEKERARRWFSNPIFDVVAERVDKSEKRQENQKNEKETGKDKVNRKRTFENIDSSDDDISELSDSELPQIPLCDKKVRQLKRKAKEKEAETKTRNRNKKQKTEELDSTKFEEVPQEKKVLPPHLVKPTDTNEIAEIQAIGSLMIHKKSRIELIDGAYNRYTYNDPPNLPSWFTEDEKESAYPHLPITKEMVLAYKARLREINNTPIKKVQEALMRKKKRARTRLKKIKEQARSIAETEDMNITAKSRIIEKLMSRATRRERRRTVIHVSKKSGGIKNVTDEKLPKGAKIKRVDSRMKKDVRAEKRAALRKNSSKKPYSKTKSKSDCRKRRK